MYYQNCGGGAQHNVKYINTPTPNKININILITNPIQTRLFINAAIPEAIPIDSERTKAKNIIPPNIWLEFFDKTPK